MQHLHSKNTGQTHHSLDELVRDTLLQPSSTGDNWVTLESEEHLCEALCHRVESLEVVWVGLQLLCQREEVLKLRTPARQYDDVAEWHKLDHLKLQTIRDPFSIRKRS